MLEQIYSFKLTIGIPIYNEIRHIENTIKSIFSEVNKVEVPIELILADNGSEDGTTELLDVLLKGIDAPESLSIVYIKNERNLGFNYNCDNIIRNSQGEYLWVLGAQETLISGALETLFVHLNRNPEQIVFNAEVWDEKTNDCLNPSIYGNIPTTHSMNTNEFFTKIGGPCRSISLNIAKTSNLRIAARNPIRSHYWGMYERHADACFSIPNCSSFTYIADPIVRILIESDGWQISGVDDFGTEKVYRSFPGFYADLEMAEIGNTFLKHGKEIRNSIGVWRDPFGVVRTLMSAKCNGLKVNSSLLWRIFKIYRTNHWFWILGLPITLTPGVFLSGKRLQQARAATHLIRKFLKKPAR